MPYQPEVSQLTVTEPPLYAAFTRMPRLPRNSALPLALTVVVPAEVLAKFTLRLEVSVPSWLHTGSPPSSTCFLSLTPVRRTATLVPSIGSRNRQPAEAPPRVIWLAW